MIFWLKLASTSNNYQYQRSIFQLNPTPSVQSHVLSIGYSPSSLQVDSCSSGKACSSLYLMIDSTRMIDSWVQITLSVDVKNQLRIFVKAIYTNLQQLGSNQNILVDLSSTQISFVNSNMYDYVPQNKFNVHPLCGQLQSLTLIQDLFTTDNTLNLDLILNYLVYLPLTKLPSHQIADRLNQQLLFNIHGELLTNNKKGFTLKNKVYMIQQPPIFGDSFTLTFWIKANSLSIRSPIMPIIQRQTAKNLTKFLLQAQFAVSGYDLLTSFSGQTADAHGKFQLQNGQFYRVVLGCYYNKNLMSYVFSLIVTNKGTPYQSLFVDSKGQLPQLTSDLLVIGDRQGVKPWASGDSVIIFDLRIFSGYSINYPGGYATENCYVSVGAYPKYCLACSSYVNQNQNTDPLQNCNEASDYSISVINYCPQGFIWLKGKCQEIQIANCARALDILSCKVCLYGHILVKNQCQLNLPKYVLALPQPSLIPVFKVSPEKSWQIDISPKVSKNIVIFIQKNKILGQLDITGESDFVIKFNAFVETQSSNIHNDIFLYFYPISILKRIQLNLITTQGLITIIPQTKIFPLKSAINITYGNQKTKSALIYYNLYLYPNTTLYNQDMSSNNFNSGIQLKYGALAGQIIIFVPIGESCTIICSTLDDSAIQSQQINIQYQQNLSISDMIVNLSIYFQNSSINLWTINNSDTFEDNFLIISTIIFSLKYMNDQNYCNLGCSGNGQCDQYNICQCNKGFNFFDCSGNVDDAIRYNVFLGILLGNLDPSQIFFSSQNISQFEQIQTLTTFILRYCDIDSFYFSLNMSQITQTVLGVLDGNIQLIKITSNKNLQATSDIVIGIASEIVQDINLLSLSRTTDMFDQILQFTNTLSMQFSNEEIDKHPSQFTNISNIKSQASLVIDQIQDSLIQYQDINSLDQIIISSGISFYKITMIGSQLIQFLSTSSLNFTSLLQSPGSIYSQLSFNNNSISALTPLNQKQEYIILISVIQQNPYSFSNNFYYPSQSLSYILIQIFDKISSVQIKKHDTQLVIWFSTNQEFKSSRRVKNQNGNYLCVQQDINQIWSQNSCVTKYVSVLYVVCNCNALGAITLIDDYNYIIMPHPIQPNYLLPINVILYIWGPIALLWLITSLWGNLQDQEESEDNVLKRKSENERLKRVSIKRVSQSLGLIGALFPSSNLSTGLNTQRKTLVNQNFIESPKNLVGQDGKLLADAFTVEELMQIQELFGEARFPNIQLVPTSIMKAQYTPNIKETNKAELKKQQENYLFILNILNTHTLIGAVYKHKSSLPRAFRLSLVFQRTNIILISTGLFVTLGLPGLFLICFCCQIFAILYRFLEQISKEWMKSSLNNYTFGTLYRLLNFMGQIGFIGLQIYVFSLQFMESDGIYVQDWTMTYVITLSFDQIIIEPIVLSFRLIWRKKMRMVKLTSKFQSNKISVSLVTAPGRLRKQDIVNTEADKLSIDKIDDEKAVINKISFDKEISDSDSSSSIKPIQPPESLTVFKPPKSLTVFKPPESLTVFKPPESLTAFKPPSSLTIFQQRRR